MEERTRTIKKIESINIGLKITFISKALRMILTILVTIVLSRLLTKEEFGLMSAALTIIGISDIFCRIGLGPALIQKQDIDEEHINSAFIGSIILGVIFSLLIYFLAPIAARFYNSQEMIGVVRPLSIIFLFNSLSNISYCLLQKRMKFVEMAIIDISAYGVYAVVGIFMAIKGLGIHSLIIANILQAMTQGVLAVILNKEKIGIKLNLIKLKELVVVGMEYTLAQIFNYISLQGDVAITGRYISLTGAGIYNRAYQLMVMPTTLIGQVLDTVLFPYLSKNQKNTDISMYVFKKGMYAIGILTLPLTIYILLFSECIITILLGNEWKDVIIPLNILSLGLFFRTGYKVSESIIKSLGLNKIRVIIQFIYAICIVCFSLIGSQQGVIGVAKGVTVSILVNFILNLYIALKSIGLEFTSCGKDILTMFKEVIIIIGYILIPYIVLKLMGVHIVLITIMCTTTYVYCMYKQVSRLKNGIF